MKNLFPPFPKVRLGPECGLPLTDSRTAATDSRLLTGFVVTTQVKGDGADGGTGAACHPGDSGVVFEHETSLKNVGETFSEPIGWFTHEGSQRNGECRPRRNWWGTWMIACLLDRIQGWFGTLTPGTQI